MYKRNRLTSWSFSRWSVYHNCPAQAKYKFIDKLPEPSSTAMARGDAIHKAAEAYIKNGGTKTRLPLDLKKVEADIKLLRKRYKDDPESIEVETTWAFRADWTRTVWNDWDGCKLRIKVDVAYLEEADDDVLKVYIKDWKTGKFTPQYNVQEYLLQLELYATGALALYANNGENRKVQVIPQLHYTDAAIIYPPEETAKVYTNKDLKPLQRQWEKRTRPMLNDTTFAPKPGPKCGWCHFRKANGGPCSF